MIEKDALFAQFVDSDFGDGTTDGEGWVIQGRLRAGQELDAERTYFINKLNVTCRTPSATDVDYDRLQLDINDKF